MAEYLHYCSACDKEFELEYSVHQDPPTNCVLCLAENSVKRLIYSAVPGKVELTGRDLKDKINSDAQAWKKEAMTNERVLADIVGENKLHQNTTTYEKQVAERNYQINQVRPTFRRK